jgi:hypothetical protein
MRQKKNKHKTAHSEWNAITPTTELHTLNKVREVVFRYVTETDFSDLNLRSVVIGENMTGLLLIIPGHGVHGSSKSG